MFVFVRWILLAAAFLTQTLFECSSAATLQACRQQILEFEAQESSTAIKSQAAALRAARKVCKVAVKNADASALREPAKHWEAMQSHALLGDVFYYGRAFELAITEALESISEAAEHFFQSSANRTQRVLYLKLPPAIRVEVIVVDDNSSDNSGAGGARNYGVAESTGQ
eukprot:gene10951-12949_t